MNRISLYLLLLFSAASMYAGAQNMWSSIPESMDVETQLHPAHYKAFSANEALLRASLRGAGPKAVSILLPTPEGTMRLFSIWETPVMSPGLAQKYPEVHTYTAIASDARHITAKLDITPKGFHACIFDGAHSYLIDPLNAHANGRYMVYYKTDYSRQNADLPSCSVLNKSAQNSVKSFSKKLPASRTNGATRKTYRLALAADSEYCAAVAGPAPTKAGVLAKMITTLNRVNGVYERELSVTMMLVEHEDTLIFLIGSPYYNASGSAMMMQNQAVVTARIGAVNYDIGHVFSTAAGGVADTASVCKDDVKAQGVTGQMSPVGDAFDIDYVAHEMGHQFGASHTFNAATGPCAGNGVPEDAFEPGSGSTIMAYAGICGSGNDFQAHSDDYFHSKSLEEITVYINTDGGTCPSVAPSSSGDIALTTFTANYSIPFLTPFELTAPAVAGDSLRYCWEERDLGDFGQSLANTRLQGPLFRSFYPNASPTRTFPALPKLLARITSYDAEKLPDTSRSLLFGLTVRTMDTGGWGYFNFPDDRVTVNVVRTPAPFTVSAPAGGDILMGGSLYTVRWDIAGTDAAPISCSQVSVLFSIDSGYTFPYVLKDATPNDGSETVRVPNLAATSAVRIKVKALGNVFFNLNTGGLLRLQHTVARGEDITITPVPAVNTLYIYIPDELGIAQLRVTDALGRTAWLGSISSTGEIPVAQWARGVYYVQVIAPAGVRATRTIVLR